MCGSPRTTRQSSPQAWRRWSDPRGSSVPSSFTAQRTTSQSARSGGAFVDEEGTIEIGYAVVESQWNRGYATAAVEAIVTKAREASEVRRIIAHTPLERPESGRVLEKAGFGTVREMEDEHAEGNAVRVTEWELATPTPTAPE